MMKPLLIVAVSMAVFTGLVENAFSKQPEKKSAPATIYPPLEIKGIRIGMTTEELTTQVPYSGCRRGECEVYTTIAGEAANFRAEIADGKLNRVYLSKWRGSDVADVVRGFQAKYGAPQVTTRVMQNTYGAHYECPLYTWSLPDGVLMVAQYRPDTRDLPQIEMVSIEQLKRDRAEHKKSEGDV